jgi:hypothetical protein
VHNFLRIYLLLCLVASSVLCQQRSHNQTEVPKDFRYPEAPETVHIDAPVESISLDGKVVGPDGFSLEQVLVEHLHTGWRRRRSAKFTDSEGNFVFTKHSSGNYYLRLSKPGFKTLLVKVLVTKKSRSPLQLTLRVSH